MSDEPYLGVAFCGLTFNNPVFTASGTFSARESGRFYDFAKLGAVTTKGVSARPWLGNNTPRIAETRSGMLNAIGLENPGADRFIAEELPFIREYIGDSGARVIVNVAGHDADEYREAAEKLDGADVDMLELNISCPNIREGGLAFGADPRMAAEVTRVVRRVARKPLIVKLTPNVTDITEIARAVESEGADALSLINTLVGMSIDADRRAPLLANVSGGLSGPAIKPVALHMVYRTVRAVRIPVIGMGGIMSGVDAAEFLMAGASAVAVGTASLIKPSAPLDICAELETFMAERGYANVASLSLGTN
ncbi:MAG: dihydroorotate dehydrogenase [Clostridiales Family XIII bacterium]|jgi:dihydroorotate dehydrogenase (NAD+) catalytic subunit|nr:dihydroorotate dehydrogenase [Clostridiales Family XIII bacterium]